MPASDRLPEQLHYRDDGCNEPPYFATSCLKCPLPQCRYDLPPKRAGALMREAELRRLLGLGHTADECATIMDVSRRTIFRLKRYAATNATIISLATVAR